MPAPVACVAFRDLLPRYTLAEQVAAAVYMADEARRARVEGVEASSALVTRFFFWLELSTEDAALLTEELFPYGGHVPPVSPPFSAP